jgi:peptidoglycan-N-acetylglucosamine deacetylase
MVAQKSDKFFLFTVDVEDWFQVENFKASIPFDTWNDRELRVEQNTHTLLDLLDETGKGSGAQRLEPTNQLNQQTNSTHNKIRATFFVLGWVAKKLPGLIREIHERGHEVASHGNNHHMCTDESARSLQKDLTDSKALLEDIIGSRVAGYRAPSFSINNDILKVIEAAGYRYDASYNSFDKHGRYGRISTDGFRKAGIAYRISDNFHEIPISNLAIRNSKLKIKNWVLPFGGGGYFRVFPYMFFKKGIRRILQRDSAYSFYLHPWEVDPGQPRVKNAPASFRFRHYINLASTERKIRKMFDDFRDCRFVTCREYLKAVATERL